MNLRSHSDWSLVLRLIGGDGAYARYRDVCLLQRGSRFLLVGRARLERKGFTLWIKEFTDWPLLLRLGVMSAGWLAFARAVVRRIRALIHAREQNTGSIDRLLFRVRAGYRLAVGAGAPTRGKRYFVALCCSAHGDRLHSLLLFGVSAARVGRGGRRYAGFCVTIRNEVTSPGRRCEERSGGCLSQVIISLVSVRFLEKKSSCGASRACGR
jgi:hypothetical protein